MQPTQKTHQEELADIMATAELDIRFVIALAGDRTLNARERAILQRMYDERGEGLYSDILSVLTHRSFPPKQARHLWDEITEHRKNLKSKLGRDVGIGVAAHDYLTNIASLMQAVSIVEESKMSSLASVATRDGLTGLFDQTSFKHRLKEELERQSRYGGPLSLVMFDLDKFKSINDTYGHTEGDIVLKNVSDILVRQARRIDTTARYGGEEFSVILPEVDNKAAFIFAERLRQKVMESFQDNPYPVTISIGIATNPAEAIESADNLIKRADTQLYKAKNSGRNKVCNEAS